MTRLTVVVPCYNEAQRLDGPPLLAFLDQHPEARLILVDDGSTDATLARIEALAAERPGRIETLALQPNRGKAEAVRAGMSRALEAARLAGDAPGQGSSIVGFLDADLSTPPDELPQLLAALDRPGVEVAIGARVALLGKDIERSAVRHYLGRVFASAASLILHARVYDTQCGAKLFRDTPSLRGALAQPFLSRWAFDVELLGRLFAGSDEVRPVPLSAVVEVPLTTWRDVKGSKLTTRGMALTLADLARIEIDLAGRRRRARLRRRGV
jgi:glycosyltransferase involved in cell wall biosynthesis